MIIIIFIIVLFYDSLIMSYDHTFIQILDYTGLSRLLAGSTSNNVLKCVHLYSYLQVVCSHSNVRLIIITFNHTIITHNDNDYVIDSMLVAEALCTLFASLAASALFGTLLVIKPYSIYVP